MSDLARQIADLPPARRDLLQLLAEEEQLGLLNSVDERPPNQIEGALLAIWRDILHVADIGLDDNYLELGGDSVDSVQIVARAKQAGIRITASQIFAHPSVAELAAVATVWDGSEEELPDDDAPLAGLAQDELSALLRQVKAYNGDTP